MTSTEPLTPERIRADVAAALGCAPDDLADGDDLTDHGLDSVRTITLVEQWRAAGADVDFPDLAELPELGRWTELLVRRAGGAT